jgi:hypothetical protein
LYVVGLPAPSYAEALFWSSALKVWAAPRFVVGLPSASYPNDSE